MHQAIYRDDFLLEDPDRLFDDGLGRSQGVKAVDLFDEPRQVEGCLLFEGKTLDFLWSLGDGFHWLAAEIPCASEEARG